MVARGEQYTGPWRVQYMRVGSGMHYTIDDARRYAAALLAAANAADRAGDDGEVA